MERMRGSGVGRGCSWVADSGAHENAFGSGGEMCSDGGRCRLTHRQPGGRIAANAIAQPG